MNRTRILLIAAAVLLVGDVAYRTWAGWGLLTIHAVDRPVGEVIREVESKGRVHIQTNLDPAKKITLHVIKAPLAYVLEVLASASETHWHVSYFLAPNKPEIERVLATVTGGSKPEGWKSWHLDLRGGFGGEEPAPSDPRRERWEIKPAEEGTLHAYLEQGAINVGARFAAPEAWNPAIASPPRPGPLSSIMPKLAKAAGGELEEVILLLGRRRDTADSGSGDGDRVRGLFSSEAGSDKDKESGKRAKAYEQRIEAEIARLPAAQQEPARREHADRKAFFESLKDLSSEERRAKIEDRMSQPGNMDRFSNGIAKRDAMKTPEQRTDKYRSYVATKHASVGQ